MANAKVGTAVVTEVKDATDVAAFDYGEDLGAGFENIQRDDIAIPFIGVLQSNSPEISSMEDAKPGMLLHSATKALTKGAEGIKFIPVFFKHEFVEWRKREAGGGIVAHHAVGSKLIKDAIAKSGTAFGNIPHGDNEIIETYYLFIVVVAPDGSMSPAVLSFTSTKIKVFRNWLFTATAVTAKTADGRRVPLPLFAHRYKLTTVGQKNNKGAFFNYVMEFDGPDAVSCRLDPRGDAFQVAKELYGAIQSGEAVADESTQSESGETNFAGPTIDADGKDEIPF